MTLDADDKQWIRATMAELVGGAAAPSCHCPRLTVAQFAAIVEMNPEVVLRKIRTREIDPRHVYGTRPKRISPLALARFGVTPQEALAILAAHNPPPSLPPSPA